jgi:Tfp pilus assembly protein FimT
MAVLLPRLGTQLSGSSLRSARLDFSSIAWAARYRAADTGAPHFVIVDRKARELRLLGRDQATVLLRKQLPQKVDVTRIELQGKESTGGDMRITFYPQGTATAAEVQLATGGERLSLTVNPANGAIHAP